MKSEELFPIPHSSQVMNKSGEDEDIHALSANDELAESDSDSDLRYADNLNDDEMAIETSCAQIEVNENQDEKP